LGFILFMDPSKHLREDATKQVIQMAITEGCYDKGKGGKFQLVAGSPFLYISGRRYPTQAYTVVCLRSHASDVDSLLKNTYSKTSHYIKFRLCTKNAQAFGKALQAQNQYLSALRTIPIVGISPEMMQDLKPKILEFEGVSEVLRSNKTEILGRWNIITYDNIFHRALKTIKMNLPQWLKELEFDEETDQPENFPDISITAQVADDDSSNSNASYMSTSAISYGSFLTTGSNDYSQADTKDYQRPTSYASATKRPPVRPTPNAFVPVHQLSISAMSSPATIPMDIQQKIKAMEDKISHFQGLEEKVERLTKILEALLGADSSEVRPTAAAALVAPLLNQLLVPPPRKSQNSLPSSLSPPRPPPPLPLPSRPTPSAITTLNDTLQSPP
jgi:hypothetical protein